MKHKVLMIKDNAPEHIKRVFDEAVELDGRITRLQNFLHSKEAPEGATNITEFVVMRDEQLPAMIRYKRALLSRIELYSDIKEIDD